MYAMKNTRDSKRTSRSHDKAVSRRVSRHEKDTERYLADRAMRSLMIEVNGR